MGPFDRKQSRKLAGADGRMFSVWLEKDDADLLCLWALFNNVPRSEMIIHCIRNTFPEKKPSPNLIKKLQKRAVLAWQNRKQTPEPSERGWPEEKRLEKFLAETKKVLKLRGVSQEYIHKILEAVK